MMKNISDINCREHKTHILCSEMLPKNRAVYEKIWKNVVQPGRPQLVYTDVKLGLLH